MSLLLQLYSLKNRLDFRLRNLLAWERHSSGNGENVGWEDLADMPFSDNPEAMSAVESLRTRYAPFLILEGIPRQALPEVFTYLYWLDCIASRWPEPFQRLSDLSAQCRWLDAGAKNWAYAPALHAFIRLHCGEAFRLDGVELDPNRRYADFRTRGQAARAIIASLPQTFYHPGDLRDYCQPADVISHFLPFVFPEPHLAWGLPLNYFDPQTLLAGLLDRLPSGGLMIIVNQGEQEAERQRELLAGALCGRAFQYESFGQLPSPFIQYRYPRYGWLCIKHDSDERPCPNGYHAGLPQ